MKTSILYRSSFLALAALIGGLTFATAQTAPGAETVQAAPSAQDAKLTNARFHRDHGGRRGHGMMGQILQKADANGDRAVTQDEINAFRAGLVGGADASGEGDISLDEFQTIYLDLTRARMVDAFQMLDADGDGAVTQAEMDTRFGDIVARMDRNDDGQLDRQDRRAKK